MPRWHRWREGQPVLTWAVGQCTNYNSTEGRSHFRPACLPTIFSYRFSQNLLKILWKNAEISGNTLSSGNYHSSLSGMCARHQTGVWSVPSCPSPEEKRSKPWMKNTYRAFPALKINGLFDVHYKNENLLWKICLLYSIRPIDTGCKLLWIFFWNVVSSSRNLHINEWKFATSFSCKNDWWK